jgi:SMC interacting uncharacterized protein involved in chromosome segregation
MAESSIKDDVLELRRTTQDLIRVVAATGQKVDSFIEYQKSDVSEIKKTVKDSCARINDLEKVDSKNSGMFGVIGHIINFIGLAILGWFQVNK